MWSARVSSGATTATDRMSHSLAARAMRMAISPRLAMKSFFSGLGDVVAMVRKATLGAGA